MHSIARIMLWVLVAWWSTNAWGQGFAPTGSLPPTAPAVGSPTSSWAATPLPPEHQVGSAATNGGQKSGSTPSLATVVGSLVIVIGLFLVVAWGMRRTMPGQVATLPREVVDVLGRAALASRQQVYLLRCGAKLLLVSVSPTGVETLTEIAEPAEVGRLLGLCVQSRPDSTTANFRQFFQQFAHEPVAKRDDRARREGHP